MHFMSGNVDQNFLSFQLSDSDTCSSFLPSHSEGV
jgi:hypothetical protein